MTQVSQPLAPYPIGGVSQQPQEIRERNQCEVQENWIGSLADALTQRPGSQHIKQLHNDFGGPVFIDGIDRAINTRYMVMVGHKEPRVWDCVTGQETPVIPAGGSGPTDFSYLTFLNTESYVITNSENLFSVNKTTSAGKNGLATSKTLNNATGRGPWGGTGNTGSFSVNTTAGPWFAWTVANGNGATFALGWNTVSVFWKTGTSANFGIAIYDDTAGAEVARVRWIVDGSGNLGTQTIQTGTVMNTDAQATLVGGGYWFCKLSYKSTTTNNMSFGPYWDTNASTQTGVVYGLRLDKYTKTAGDYIRKPREAVRGIAISDNYLIVNTAKTTAMGSTTAATPKQVTITLSGVPATDATIILTPATGTAQNIVFKASAFSDSAPNWYIRKDAGFNDTSAKCGETLAQKIQLATGLFAATNAAGTSVTLWYYDMAWTVTESGDSGSAISIGSATAFNEVYLPNKDATYSSRIGIRIKQGSSWLKAAAVMSTSPTATQGEQVCVLFSPAVAHAASNITQANCEETGGAQDYHKGVFFGASGLGRCTDISPEGLSQHLTYKSGSNLYDKGLKQQFTSSPFAVTNSAECRQGVIRLTSISAFDEIIVEDSAGGSWCYKIQGELRDDANLPKSAVVGTRIKITRSENSNEDDYWIQAESKDNSKGFCNVGWRECVAPTVVANHDKTTMPVVLIRKQDNDVGSVTGAYTGGGPNAIYWEYNYFGWSDREVGDDDSNAAPAYIGDSIRNIFYNKGRLGLLSTDQLSMSQTNILENFFRTTVQTSPEADPIDARNQAQVSANYIRPNLLNSAVPFKDKILLFSDAGVFGVTGEPILSFKTIAINPIEDVTPIAHLKPQVAASSCFFGMRRGNYTIIRELLNSFEALDQKSLEVTEWVRRYITGIAFQMAVSPQEGLVAIATDNGNNTIWLYKWEDTGPASFQGSNRKASWQKVVFSTADVVVGHFFITSDHYVCTHRPYGFYLDMIPWAQGDQDTGQTWICCLDRRMSDETPGLTASYSAPNTTFDFTGVNYFDTSVDQIIVVNKATGAALTVVSRTATTITVSGDQRLVPVWIGLPYLRKMQATPAQLRENGQAVADGKIAYVDLLVVYRGTGALDVGITRKGRTQVVESLSIAAGKERTLLENSAPALYRGMLAHPITGAISQDTLVELRSSSHLPATIVKLECRVDIELAAKRQP